MTNDKPTGRHTEQAAELDAATKARIRAEEIERARVRAELEGAPTPAPTPEPAKSFRLQGSTPSKNRRTLNTFFALLVIAGGAWWLSQPHGVPTTSVPVTYSIASSCPVDVTYTVNGVDTQQESNVPSGWSHVVQQSSLTNQLLAQLQCQGGTVTATVSAEGQAPKSVTSSGDYAMATVAYP